MQINNRLFEIIYILMQKRKITAKELADKFEVSTRTIYRDIEILCNANIPIYSSKGKDGGICLLDEYILNKALLSEEEQNQILFALQGMKKVAGQDEKHILEKLSMLFNKKVDDWIKIDFSNWGKDNTQKERFDILKTAILNKNKIEFTYYNSNGDKSKRIVEPLQIWFKDKSWYLISYCKLKEDYRIFKIARIKDINILGEHFKRDLPEEPKKEKYNFEIISLELEISKKMAFRVYDEFESNDITKNQDGNFIVKVEYPENEWVYSYILSFGEYIKILSPNKIKNILKDKLEKTLKNFL